MRRAAFTCTALLLSIPLHFTHAPLQAQGYNWDVTANGGYSTWTHALSHHQIGFDNVSGFSLGGSPIGGAQLGYWITPYIGARLNFAYAESRLEQGPTVLFNRMNQWGGTGDVLLRFLKPRRSWSGTEVLPFIGLGIGMQWINPAGDQFDVIVNGDQGIPITCLGGLCRGPITPGFPGIRTLGSLGERTFFLKQTSTFSGLASIGLDVRLARQFALRLEAGDRMWQAPIAEIAQSETAPPIIVLFDNSVGSTVHHLFITGGVSFLFGLHAPPPAYVAMAAPPMPPPEKPAPRPPTTESIKVCVIDPTITDGVRTITATRDLHSGDTTVVRQGRRVPLAAITAKVTVARNARWHMTGAPFVIGSGPNKLVYEPTGSAHAVAPTDLSFIGTVDGLPVYIGSAQVAKPLENLGPTTDLARTVTQRADVRAALEGVNEILVPLNAAGCDFQPLVLQAQARKK